MEINPQISIVVPVYNTEDFLEECLTSIIAQTYKNLEIVVLNNGSTDKSLEIIEKFALRDSRINYYTIDHVDTVTESRNNAFLRAKAEWIIPIDSDDYIEKDYVEKLWRRHLATGADFVGSYMVHFDSKSKEILYTIPNDKYNIDIVYTGKEALVDTIGKWRWNISGNGPLLKRDIIPCIISNTPTPKYNDEYNLREMFLNAKMVSFANAYYFYRMNPNSTGKKMSYAKLSYAPITHIGLLKLIEKSFGTKSDVFIKESLFSRYLIMSSVDCYIEAKHVLCKKEKKKYKDLIWNLFLTIKFPIRSIKDILIMIYCYYKVFLLQLI